MADVLSGFKGSEFKQGKRPIETLVSLHYSEIVPDHERRIRAIEDCKDSIDVDELQRQASDLQRQVN